MKSFKEIAILEALKIVKRASDKNNPQADKRQDNINKIHNTEMKDAQPVKNQIGDINGFPIVKSDHVHQVRSGEQNTRDAGIKDSIVVKSIKSAVKKGFSEKSGKTLITFMNKKSKKYNMMIAVYHSHAIVIVTIIQGEKENAKMYWTPNRKDHEKITTESYEYYNDINDINKIIQLGEID